MKRGPSETPTGLLEPERAGGGLIGDDAAPPAAASGNGTLVPARAEGVTLIGEFEQSGFEQPPSLVRRKDGQVVQLTELLYFTLEAVDGQRDLDGIAGELSQRLGRTATAENVRFLLDEKLRPLGLLKKRDGSEPSIRKSNPLLALRWKVVLSGERLTNRLTAPFARLFHGPIVVAVLLGFVAVCGWVLFLRGMAQGTRQALYSPGLLLMVFGLTVLSAGFHEFGHAAACRFSGGRPGVMGAGIYLVWPAFYTDVTDAYRLDRGGRLRTSLGGLYFNALFVLATFGAWAVTGSEVFLLFVPIQLFQMLHQLLPVVRMDGYHILSDLTGVPDLFARIKPTLKAAVPGKEADQRATQLKRWVRITVTAWVLVVVPLLLLSMVLAAIALPRLAATAWDSLGHQWEAIRQEAGDGRWLGVGSGAVAIFALLVPLAGTTYMLVRIVRRAGARAWRATSERRVVRAMALGGAALAVAGLAWLWWPNGEYEPIAPDERGTLTDGIEAARQIGTGRPAFTPNQQTELEAVPEAPLTQTESPLEDTAGDQDETSDTTVTAQEPAQTTTAPPAPSTTVTRPLDADDARPTTGNRAPRRPDIMMMRRITRGAVAALVALLFGVAPGVAALAQVEPPLEPSGGDTNEAVAVNTEDGASVFRLAFSIRHVTDGTVDQQNTALAYASCADCKTVALAFQVVIVVGDANYVAPVNQAGAVNDQCAECLTFASATQIVIGVDQPVVLTAEGRRRLVLLYLRMRALEGRMDQLTAAQLATEVSAIEQELIAIFSEELVPAGSQGGPPGAGATTTTAAVPTTATSTTQISTPATTDSPPTTARPPTTSSPGTTAPAATGTTVAGG